MNNSALVQGLRQQDPAAVKHLSDSFLPSVWRFVYVKVNRDRHLAEDIVSETVLALIKAVAEPEIDIQNPGAWLRSVASNKVTDHFRAAARVQHLIDEVKQTSPVSDNNDAVKQKELEERRAEIRRVMDDLTEQHRIVLEWKYIEKLSVRAMADRLETTEKAVESVLFRARRDFRERMIRTDGCDASKSCCNRNGTKVAESSGSSATESSGASGDSGDSEDEPVVEDQTLRAEGVT